MPFTRAGWRVEAPGSKGLTVIHHDGHPYVVKRGTGGGVARAMLWLIMELDCIESVNEPGWDGTYNYRPVRGGVNWSEHAAGTAYDHNASQHPQGGGRYAGFTDLQVCAIRTMLATPKGACFKWGADFTVPSRQDAMHFEMRSPATYLRHATLFRK